MMTPEIKELIHKRFNTKSVIICGLEVIYIYIYLKRNKHL